MRISDFLLSNRKQKNVNIFFDIETLLYNIDNGIVNPRKYKSKIYSFAISFFDLEGQLHVQRFANTDEFLNETFLLEKKVKRPHKFTLFAHNGNKFDNHFFKFDIEKHIFKTKSLKLRNADNLSTSLLKKDISKYENIILEKRVKSKTNLELTGYFNGVAYETVDTWLKTNQPLSQLGHMLHNQGLLDEKYLKTEFDYERFNLHQDLNEQEAISYCKSVFKSLSKDDFTYIDNDVIILAHVYKYYDRIFKGFDFKAVTLTKNISNAYTKNNPKTSFELLNKYEDKYQNDLSIDYSKYELETGENLYTFFKSFYKGGLNLYNDKYIEKKVKDCFSIDINSSYPYVMYSEKVPVKLLSIKYNLREKPLVFDSNYFTMYRMTKENFRKEVLKQIKSSVIKKLLVKYYNNSSIYVNINNKTFEMLKNFISLNKKYTFEVVSTYWCEYFSARDTLFYYYKVKSQASAMKKEGMRLEMDDNPYDYVLIPLKEGEYVEISQEDIDLAKLMLNGIYGLPALRAFFNMFQRDEFDDIINVVNGFKNSPRNIVFSAFVTACALKNLIKPLTEYLKPREIDDNFVYSDTDSLYLKKDVYHKLPTSLFDKYSLGKWDIENDNITTFFIQNHKKYAYESLKSKCCFSRLHLTDDEQKKCKKLSHRSIHARTGGMDSKSVERVIDKCSDFNEFVDKYFSTGSKFPVTRSILNEQGVIAIYNGETELQRAKTYSEDYDFEYEIATTIDREEVKKMLIDEEVSNADEIMYVETPFGTYTYQELFPYEYEKTDNTIEHLINKYNVIYKELYEN